MSDKTVMDKRSLDLLEKVFAAEIDGALSNSPEAGIYQTKSKLAEKLEADGLIVRKTIVLAGRFPVKIDGYVLTLLGNATYCMSERCEK